MKTVSVAIPWTGGYDSTALILMALRDVRVSEIHPIYVELGNNEAQTKRETTARAQILNILKDSDTSFKLHPPKKVFSFCGEEETQFIGEIQSTTFAHFLAASRQLYDEIWVGYTGAEYNHFHMFRTVYENTVSSFKRELSYMLPSSLSCDSHVSAERFNKDTILRAPLIGYESKEQFLNEYEESRYNGLFELLSTSEQGHEWRTKEVAKDLESWSEIGDRNGTEMKCLILNQLYQEYCRRKDIKPKWIDTNKKITECPIDKAVEVNWMSRYADIRAQHSKLIESLPGLFIGVHDDYFMATQSDVKRFMSAVRRKDKQLAKEFKAPIAPATFSVSVVSNIKPKKSKKHAK